MTTIYLDLETLPDLTVPPADRVVPVPAPSNYKSEAALAKWADEHPPTDEAWRKTALDWRACRVLCVGVAVDDAPAQVLTAEYRDGAPASELDAAEALLLRRLGSALVTVGAIRMTTWNGKAFDLPILAMRAARYSLDNLGLALPVLRWDKRGMDLWEVMQWGHYRGNPGRQQDVVRYLGIESQDGIDGSEVYDAWSRGDLDAITHHCAEDVRELREVHRALIAGGLL